MEKRNFSDHGLMPPMTVMQSEILGLPGGCTWSGKNLTAVTMQPFRHNSSV